MGLVVLIENMWCSKLGKKGIENRSIVCIIEV